MLKRAALASLVALACIDAHAQQTIIVSNLQQGWQAGTTSFVRKEAAVAALSRTWSTVGSQIAISDAVVLSGPAGSLAVATTARATAVQAAKAIAVAALLPEAALIATVLGTVYAAYNVYNSAGNLMVDPGTATVAQDVVCWRGPFNSTYPSKTGCITVLATAGAADWDKQFTSQGYTPNYNKGGVTCNATTYVCHAVMTSKFSPFAESSYDFQYGREVTTQNQCPMSVDASNPANTIPAGSAPYPDGSCPTARYNHQPITPDQFAERVGAHPEYTTPDALKDAVKATVEHGGKVEATTGPTTGPASQTGTPATTTTTGPGGTSTTTTTPKYTYTYSPDSITWSPSQTITTTAPDGSTTTTNSDDKPAAVTIPDFCLDFPERAGCKEVGQPPAQEDINRVDKEVTFTPSGGFGADNGTCPGLVVTQSIGAVDVFGLFCTYMSGIRFAVIGIAWIIGAMIFIGRADT